MPNPKKDYCDCKNHTYDEILEGYCERPWQPGERKRCGGMGNDKKTGRLRCSCGWLVDNYSCQRCGRNIDSDSYPKAEMERLLKEADARFYS